MHVGRYELPAIHHRVAHDRLVVRAVRVQDILCDLLILPILILEEVLVLAELHRLDARHAADNNAVQNAVDELLQIRQVVQARLRDRGEADAHNQARAVEIAVNQVNLVVEPLAQDERDVLHRDVLGEEALTVQLNAQHPAAPLLLGLCRLCCRGRTLLHRRALLKCLVEGDEVLITLVRNRGVIARVIVDCRACGDVLEKRQLQVLADLARLLLVVAELGLQIDRQRNRLRGLRDLQKLLQTGNTSGHIGLRRYTCQVEGVLQSDTGIRHKVTSLFNRQIVDPSLNRPDLLDVLDRVADDVLKRLGRRGRGAKTMAACFEMSI